MRLHDLLKDCKKEEEVKAEFLKEFGSRINALNMIDHYTPEILFEFKYNKGFANNQNKDKARALAQTMYYVRKLRHSTHVDFIDKTVPPVICIVDKTGGFFVHTEDFKEYYQGQNSEKYDWDLAPSTPCRLLIKDIEQGKQISDITVYNFSLDTDESAFRSEYANYSHRISLGLLIKKNITEDNFWAIYKEWNKKFGSRIPKDYAAAEIFLSDIQVGNTQVLDNDQIGIKINGLILPCRISQKSYNDFWQNYEKIPKEKILLVRQRKAILTEDFERRMKGEYYTPIDFAEKGLEYLTSVLGKNWYKNGEYRIWDMAAGTGNLELRLPSEALQYCYLSTIEQDDVDYLKKIFPVATVFQYDYLNDDIAQLAYKDDIAKQLGNRIKISTKMPEKLLNDLNNDNIKWVILLNPPWKTTNNNEARTWMNTWDGVSKTSVREWMATDDLLETSREVYMQFLYRISKEFNNKNATLCLYSTLKYLNSNNDQRARDKFVHWRFKKGYIFNAKCFYKAKAAFPVAYAIWDMRRHHNISNKSLFEFDVFNQDVEKIGKKLLKPRHRDEMLNKWCPRYSNTRKFVPFSSAFSVASANHQDVRNKIADDFLCSLSSQSDVMQDQNYWGILSAPHVSAGAFSVTPNNFEKSMILHAVKKIPAASWTNNRDHFYAPLIENFAEDFVSDCVVWSTFADSNNAVALKDVEWDGQTWQIANHLFPFLLQEVRTWDISSTEINYQLFAANEDRYLAKWIAKHQLSQEAASVMDAARDLYKTIYANITKIAWADAKIDTWDFGLTQIKRAIRTESIDIACNQLATLKEMHKCLTAKISPRIYEYGFIDADVDYFDTEE